MTTSTLTRPLNVNELLQHLADEGYTTKYGKAFTDDKIRQAVMYGWLVASKRGYDNEFTPEAVQAWIAEGCRYAVKRGERGEE